MRRVAMAVTTAMALGAAGAPVGQAFTQEAQAVALDELFQAIRARDIARVEALTAADPSLVGRRNPQGISPLSWAAYLEQPALVELLKGKRGTPDFYEACIVGDEPVVRASLARGQDMNTPAPDGFTALGLAVFFRQPAVARLLIDAGADLNQRAANLQQVAPIHAAVARNDIPTLELLLTRGADPDLPQAKRVRPIHDAAASGNVAAVAMLLLFGASPEAETEEGQRPADLARAKGHPVLAERLLAASTMPRP